MTNTVVLLTAQPSPPAPSGAGLLAQVLAVGGASVLLLAAIGLLRFADVYTRISAAGTATGVGITLIILAAVTTTATLAGLLTGALAIAAQLATAGAAGITLGRAALLTGHAFRPDTATPEDHSTAG